MSLNFDSLGLIASGGTLLQLTSDSQQRLWAVTMAGLFRHDSSGWRSVRRGVPFWRLTAVLAHNNNLWVAGLPNGIIRSSNGGRSWSQCWIEQTDAPIVAIALSANYRQDRVLLAATDGGGLLRSTDGGRHWELANFGLRDFSVLDVVVAPLRGRYEDAFAITETGIYHSPNGGRAWRRADLAQPDLEPLALAVSPDFAHDQTVCVGTAAGALLCSRDAGQTWDSAGTPFDTINSLAFAPDDTLLLGTMSGIVAYDLANKQVIDETAAPPVLTLRQLNGRFYAGLFGGLLLSADNGRSWQPEPSFTARRFVWLQPAADGSWLAAGPDEGVWKSVNAGATWQAVWEETAVVALTTTPDNAIWISSGEALLTSADGGATWQEVAAPSPNIIALQAVGDALWAGSQDGQLWLWQRGKWTARTGPWSAEQLLALFTEEEAILTAVWSAKTGSLQIWRSKNGGLGWSEWFSQPAQPILPHLLLGETAVVGLGTHLYHQNEQGWQRQRVTSQDKPITALARQEDKLFASFTEGIVMATSIGATWATVAEGLRYEPFVALQPNGDKLLALSADGRCFGLTPSD